MGHLEFSWYFNYPIAISSSGADVIGGTLLLKLQRLAVPHPADFSIKVKSNHSNEILSHLSSFSMRVNKEGISPSLSP